MLKFNELGLSPNLLRGVDELGFINPTPIQEKIIPCFFETHKDIIGLAQTGTGKTAAYGLPVIEKSQPSAGFTQTLILAPTRELCVQITQDLKNYSKYVQNIRIVPVYGGASIDTQIKALRRGASIIVATPGRMLDLIRRKAADISQIQNLILDEADEMLNMGFKEELDSILSMSPEIKRSLLFSATMSKEVMKIANKYLSDPEKITIGNMNAGAENVKHVYYQVHAKDRYLALKRIADMNPEIYGLIFCRTRQETKEVADKLIKDGYNADALHGDLSQAQRDHVMKRFRDKTLQMLVATDVAARGLDINSISHVINYNLPEDPETYTHRSGRTGRADKSGISVSIVNYREVSRIPQIEKILQKKITKLQIPTGTEICQKQLFNLIDRMENVEVDEEQIAPFMDAVNKKLEWLSKEDIIKHFLSLEFNRFLEYYRNASDLNDNTRPEVPTRRKNGSESGGKNFRKRKKQNFTRLFVNAGKKDGLIPKNVIGMINDNTGDRDISVGDIDIKDSFSFFEVGERHTDKVMSSLSNVRFKGRKLQIQFAMEDQKSMKKKTKKKNKRSRVYQGG